MKVTLYDNGKKVSHISIICMFRNNEDYIVKFFKNVTTEMEEMYDTLFNYYIIENNSTRDNTREILRDFIKTKSDKSKLLLFNLENDYRNIGDGKNFERLYNLARIRNKLVDSIVPLDSQWCLFIDSNIYFKKEILQNMFIKSSDTIGMMVPYTQQLFIPEIHGKYMKLEKPTLFGHFYDTFSFFDKNNKTFWPYCGFERCNYCNRKNCNNRDVISKDEDIVDVGACFSGFALIRTEIINNKKIRWDTASHEVQKDESICEHFLFCYLLKKLTDKRIVMLQHVDDIFRTY